MPTDAVAVRYLNPPALERPPGYSHVVDVRGNRLIFIAGQAGVDATGTVIGGDNVEAQTEQTFRNLAANLLISRTKTVSFTKFTAVHPTLSSAGPSALNFHGCRRSPAS